MMYVVKLNNSILGWMLVPTNDDAKTILAQMYMVENYDATKRSEIAFMKGETVDKVLAHVREVCQNMNIKMSVCGKPASPTIRLWWTPVEPALTPEQVSVDLKWSCWSVDESLWEERAPGVWERMRKAWAGETVPLTINTGPRKEIRYGSVTISKGQARGYFCTEWDDVSSLADTLDTPDDQAFADMIPFSSHTMEPGMDWEFGVKAKSFARLMERIDQQEDELLTMDRREWEFIASCFKK